jgi:hypothetical protein
MRRKIVRDPLCPICGLEVETESYFIGMPLGDGCVCGGVWEAGKPSKNAQLRDNALLRFWRRLAE